MWAEGRQFENKDEMTIKHPYYFASLSFIDYEIGRLLKKIDELYPDALVIYTSDHGDFLNASQRDHASMMMFPVFLLLSDGRGMFPVLW